MNHIFKKNYITQMCAWSWVDLKYESVPEPCWLCQPSMCWSWLAQ